MTDTQQLKREVEFLRRRRQLALDLDDLLENSTRFGHTIEATLDAAIPMLQSLVPGAIVRTRTVDERGRHIEQGVSERWPVALALAALDDASSGEVERIDLDHGRCFYRRFDVVDQHLGVAAMWWPHAPEQTLPVGEAAETLNDWVEVLDNFLAAKAMARRTHEALTRISDGLKHAILEEGIDAAVEIFAEYANFKDLLLVCQSDDVLERHTTCFRVFRDGELQRSSRNVELAASRTEVERVGREPTEANLRSLGLASKYWVKAPLMDALDRRLAGLVVFGSDEPLRPFQSELADRFADYLRQRVVDFSKEFEALSNTFPPPIVTRLLQETDYVPQYLTAREREVAILYADVAGFTHVSEQVLVEPEIIARLMDVWGYEAVQIIWDTGGVFDKMVGDCVIAHWGPPFYEMSAREACRGCAEAARRIRSYTQELKASGAVPELDRLEGPLGVSIGLNYAPLFVGRLGPGQDFTGFSSGMNNTARLQGLAERDEILCMEPFVEAYGDDDAFGPGRSGVVKNVSEPIVFRALATPGEG